MVLPFPVPLHMWTELWSCRCLLCAQTDGLAIACSIARVNILMVLPFPVPLHVWTDWWSCRCLLCAQTDGLAIACSIARVNILMVLPFPVPLHVWTDWWSCHCLLCAQTDSLAIAFSTAHVNILMVLPFPAPLVVWTYWWSYHSLFHCSVNRLVVLPLPVQLPLPVMCTDWWSCYCLFHCTCCLFHCSVNRLVVLPLPVPLQCEQTGGLAIVCSTAVWTDWWSCHCLFHCSVNRLVVLPLPVPLQGVPHPPFLIIQPRHRLFGDGPNVLNERFGSEHCFSAIAQWQLPGYSFLGSRSFPKGNARSVQSLCVCRLYDMILRHKIPCRVASVLPLQYALWTLGYAWNADTGVCWLEIQMWRSRKCVLGNRCRQHLARCGDVLSVKWLGQHAFWE